jgi:hypothetical protein
MCASLKGKKMVENVKGLKNVNAYLYYTMDESKKGQNNESNRNSFC